MSDDPVLGTFFKDNTVTYEHNVPPTTIDLLTSNVKIAAGQTVEHVNGFNSVITYLFFPGIPPKPNPTHFGATSISGWKEGEIVVITGPFGEEGNRTIQFRGTQSEEIATFKELLFKE